MDHTPTVSILIPVVCESSSNCKTLKPVKLNVMKLFYLTIVGVVCIGSTSAFLKDVMMPPPRPPSSRPLPTSSSTSLHAVNRLIGSATVIALTAAKSLCLVRQGDVAIVERLGKFHARLGPGLHVTIPFADSIRATLTDREQVLDIPPQDCITSDNAPLAADAVVYWRVVDAERAVYAVVNLELAIQNLVLTQLRAEIGRLSLDETFSARERINGVLLSELDETTAPWGVKITRVEVRDIIPKSEILRAMEMQMAAERTKRASVIKSEGEREKSINEAEGRARSCLIDAEAAAKAVRLGADAESEKIRIEAEGAAQALEVLASAVEDGGQAAARFQLMREYVAAQRDLATSSNSKVVVASGSADDIFAKAVAFYDREK